MVTGSDLGNLDYSDSGNMADKVLDFVLKGRRIHNNSH